MTDFLVHHDVVTAPGSSPDRYMLVLHGILGSGANWRTFARRLAAACPSWGFVLVDLRAHGQSADAPPPHSLRAAADDLVRLQEKLALPVRGVLGHSFGGKVALALADTNPTRLDQVWVLDSQPGARLEELTSARTARVVRMLEEMPKVLPSRERFVEIVEERGHDRTFAAWLAMNLRRANGGSADGGYQLRVDMQAIRALFESYYETDLWYVVDHHEKARDMIFVVGGKSDVVGPADRARLAEIAARAPHVTVHTLPEAGHWLHVDDPEGLFAIVQSSLCAPAATD
jgi:pimeloyl-ACP methyl ester carboxylesterase